MADEGDELIFAADCVRVSRASVVTAHGTFPVRQISEVRATHTHGTTIGYALGVVGLVLLAGAVWIGDGCFGLLSAIVLALGVGAFLMRPTGSLYLKPNDGGKERLVARGPSVDITEAANAIEQAIASARV